MPNQQGENHSQATIDEKTARNIQQDLMNFDIPQRQIVGKYKTTIGTVEAIKIGHTWNYYNLTYPLRPSEEILNKQKALKVIDLIKNTQLSFQEIAAQVGWGKSQISMINKGNNHRQETEKYPLRKDPKDYNDKIDQCIILLQQNKKNGEIAEILGTSAAWVSRINCGKTHKNPNIIYPIRK